MEHYRSEPTIEEIVDGALNKVALKVDGVFFNEEGYVLAISQKKGTTEEACEIAGQIIHRIRRIRREFRKKMREEVKRAERDPRVPKPTPRHSSFRQNGGPTLRREIPRLKEMGYTSAHLWVPMCQHMGCGTYGWLLWPPAIPDEKSFLFQRVASLDEAIFGTKGWVCDTKDLVSRITPQGITYSGYLRMVSPCGSGNSGTVINVLVE